MTVLTGIESKGAIDLGSVMAAIAAAGPFWLGKNRVKMSNDSSAGGVVTVNKKDSVDLYNTTLTPGASTSRAYSNETL